MHTQSWPLGRAALRRIPYHPTKETVNEEFPFLLITGRTLYQFNAGTMTMRTANAELRATDLLEISVEDAKRLQLPAGSISVIATLSGRTLAASTSRWQNVFVWAIASIQLPHQGQEVHKTKSSYQGNELQH
jgi:formate dehydrogenase major subunit